MRYRDDIMNKMPYFANPQQMPAEYGIYSGAAPAAVNYGSMPAVPSSGGYPMQPYTHNGSGMGTKMQSGSAGAGIIPATLPAAPSGMTPAAITPAVPALPSASGCGGQAYPAASGQSGTGAAQPGPGWTQMPTTVESTLFTPGFLRTQIGRRVRVEFLIGTNNLTDRTGTLVAVGASYILIRPVDSDDLMMCDIYSIKFVTIIL